MTGVTHGADAERLQSIATELSVCAQRARDVVTLGHGSTQVLLGAWQGPDAEHFVHAWGDAGRSIEEAAEHLQQAADELRRQSDEQAGASGVRSTGAGDPASPEPDEGKDDDDSQTGGTSQGPGFFDNMIYAFGAPFLPPGLELTDPEVLELAQSPEGREWLAWLNENEIQVVHGANVTEYLSSEDTIFFGDGADETALIHEASHAKWDLEGKDVGITEVGKQEYVDHQIDNETDAMLAEFHYLEATGADPQTLDDEGFTAYMDAKETALADGATAEEAEAAGASAVRERFTSGVYQPNGQPAGVTYMDYYGDAWEARNS